MTGHFQSFDMSLQPSPDGLRRITVYSDVLRHRADLTLFAPAEADPAAALPLVILLHGVYGSHWSWSDNARAHRTMQQMIAAGDLPPALLAMPSDGLFGVGSGYLDRPHENAEKWITDDVPRAVQQLFPNAGTSYLGIAGLSMGGWGALRIAARHPGRFEAAVGLSPLVRVDQIAEYAERDRAAHAPEVDDADLVELLLDPPGALPRLRIACGIDDPLLQSARRMHDALSGAAVPHEYQEAPNGHDWDFWSAQVRPTLAFLARGMPPVSST